MNTNWFDNKNLTCLVICAGKGTRLIPYSEEMPKAMILLNNKPILHYLIDYWKKYTKNFVFIVGYKKNHIVDYTVQLEIRSQFVEQKKLKGIANAISLAKDFVSQNFIVVLGDCICLGTFSSSGIMTQGIGVWKTENKEYIKNNYAVFIENDRVTKVMEKPKETYNNLCGMGVYLLNKKIFHYIDVTSPSPLTNEVEITDVIQTMIDANEKINPVYFNGDYININSLKDLEKAQELLLKNRRISPKQMNEPIFSDMTGGFQ